MPSVLTAREYAFVWISGPGPHAAVTAALQLTPSDAWNAGDVNPSTGRARRAMSWQLRSDLDDTRPLHAHVDALLTVLATRANELRGLWVDYDLVLQCVGHYPSGSHGVHLDREVVRRAASLGLAIDLDFYVVEEHADDGNPPRRREGEATR